MPRTRRRLRIAQVSPLYESVPPRLYGGTERIVSYLTEELVAEGHDVTLFASGDSHTGARLIAPCAHALRLADVTDPLPYHFAMLEQVYRRARDFDLVHFHVDYLHFAGTRRTDMAHVTTLHGRLDLVDLVPLYGEFDDMPLVSISHAQRRPLPDANWAGNVYHGLPLDLHQFGPGGDYLAFVGRVSQEKRLDRAIEIAERAGLPLKVAAKIDKHDRAYHREVEPLINRGHVEFLGELDETDKGKLLAGARALLFPIDWPEPFGLVMIEAMACGTPVIAWRNGSVPEVLGDDGVAGVIVDSIDDAVAAVDHVRGMSREAVRERFEQRFSAARMVRDYVDLYHHLIGDDARDRSREPGLLHPGDQLARG